MADHPSLKDQLLSEDVRPRFLSECEQLLDDEVGRKRGLSGVAIKGAYKAVKAIKPGFVKGVMDVLLDEWVAELEPEHTAWREAGASGQFSQRLTDSSDAIAERLLRVTDWRAENTRHTSAKKLYQRLRPNAKSQVIEALPRVGTLVDRHLDS